MRALVMVVIGTRPDAIKLWPVVRQLESSALLAPLVVSTGQHSQLLAQVLDVLSLRPDHELSVMTAGQSLDDVLTRCVTGVGELIDRQAPAFVLVQGDTTTALAAALAAFHRRVTVGHVEAGLRSGRRDAPFPEEVNRRLVSALAELHFAPTERARDNLLREGIAAGSVHVTGNTVVDTLHWMLERPAAAAEPDDERPMVLVTGHRRESFGPGFEAICRGLRRAAERNRDVDFVYPVHLNPNVREPVGRILGGVPNIRTIEPVRYDEFVALMRRCRFIISDSGGVQEEAPTLGRPVLVLREVTERPEGVEVGAVRLIGTDADRIVTETERLLRDPEAYRAMVPGTNPFGDGRAAQRIAAVLEATLPGRG